MSKHENGKYSHNKKEKELRKLMTKLRKLQKAQRNLGWIELDKPEHWGWEKVLILRDDIARRNNVKFFEELLELVNQKDISNTKSFVKRNWSTGKKEEIKLMPKVFPERDLDKIPIKFHDYFTLEVDDTTYYWGSFSRKYYSWVMNKPYLLKEKIQKHYVTKKRLYDSDLESQINEIEQYIDAGNLWVKWSHINGARQSSSYERASRHARKRGQKFKDKLEIKEDIESNWR